MDLTARTISHGVAACQGGDFTALAYAEALLARDMQAAGLNAFIQHAAYRDATEVSAVLFPTRACGLSCQHRNDERCSGTPSRRTTASFFSDWLDLKTKARACQIAGTCVEIRTDRNSLASQVLEQRWGGSQCDTRGSRMV